MEAIYYKYQLTDLWPGSLWKLYAIATNLQIRLDTAAKEITEMEQQIQNFSWIQKWGLVLFSELSF